MNTVHTPFRIEEPFGILAWIVYYGWQNKEYSHNSIHEGVYRWRNEDAGQWVAQLGQCFASTPKAVIGDFENVELLVTYHDPRSLFSETHNIIDIFKALARHPLKSPAHAHTIEDAYKFATDLLSNRDNMLAGIKKDCLEIVKYCPNFLNYSCATNVFIGFFLNSMEISEGLGKIDTGSSDQREIEKWRRSMADEMCGATIVNGTCTLPMAKLPAFHTVSMMIHDLLNKDWSSPFGLLV